MFKVKLGCIAPRDREGVCVRFSLAPFLRGEGWGEGLLPRVSLPRVSLTRRYAPTSPRKRGEVKNGEAV
jgi:hypothetical protein